MRGYILRREMFERRTTYNIRRGSGGSSPLGQVQWTTVPLTTGADPVAAFPFTVPLDSGMPAAPKSVSAARLVNNTDPSAITYEAPWVDWAPVSGGISVRYVSGLEPSTSYSLILLICGG